MINASSNNSIGIFDSGIGGTSIWKEIHALLPNEDTVYLSDSKNAPYGLKSKEEIIDLSIKNTELLIKEGAKIIVVACNTATTNAIQYLRNNYQIPFIGIEPAIKPAAIKTKTNKIGILATKGTLNSELFEHTSSKIDKHIKIIEQVGEGLVELIENNKIESSEMSVLLKKYLSPMLEQKIDHLVLGCTHYPYLIPQIRKIIGEDIQIIDSGEAVAKQTKNILSNLNLLNKESKKSTTIFYINKDEVILEKILLNYPNSIIKKRDF
ncbi:glutamate racemase [Tenacibaculum sp. IB213877]|uniref:glutamate racemase n=1 Tax=Tenacibaculum sp. IB213877 TaxID=3097351 RepID=UPI002A59A674|nr:glutamate racemase [Tenacibaculum sp. IB213877]MDY0780877.1 glutamate racemase [Tenacibaculum sp. IB213877]